jgi:hypothetical protein
MPSPDRREHIPPSRWREEEAQRLKVEAARVEAERRSLAAEVELVTRQRAEVEAELASLRVAEQRAAEREAAATAREQEADGLIAVVEAIEAGAVSFDDDGRLVVPPRRTPEQQGLLDRIGRGGFRSKRSLARAGAAYGRPFASAAAVAEHRLREEFAIAAKAVAAANRFLRKAALALPEELRARFRADISAEDAQLLEAREDLDDAGKRHRNGRNDGELE